MSDFDKLFKRLDMLLDRVETMVPAKTETRTEAVRFATQRGSRSGRIAVQFAPYWESLQ